MPNKNLSQTITQAYTFARRMAPKKFTSIERNDGGPMNKLILLDRSLEKTDYAKPTMFDVTVVAIGAPGCVNPDGIKLGAVYLYKGGNTDIDKNWKFKSKLFYPLTGNEDKLPLDGSDLDFGYSVSIIADGSLLAVGAPGERSDAGDRTGAVYLFSVSENGDQCTFITKIVPPDPSPNKDFGRSIAFSDDGKIIYICDKKIDKLAKVYIFTKIGDDYSNWFFSGKRNTRNESALYYTYRSKNLKLEKTSPEKFSLIDTANGATPFVFMGKEIIDMFGMGDSIGIDFCIKNKIDRKLRKKTTIENPNNNINDSFGYSFCASPPYMYRLVIGAPGTENNSGRAYIYVYDGENFTLFNTLVTPDSSDGDKFGFSCTSSSERENTPCYLYAISEARSPVGPFTKTSSWSSSYTYSGE